MLVLSRKQNEKIIITRGDLTVTVTVAKIAGDKVWLGFDAPLDVTINREEVEERIREEARNPKS